MLTNIFLFSGADFPPSCELIKGSCNESGLTRDCYHLPQLNKKRLDEECVQGDSYDYFYMSELSYILSFIFVGAFIVGSFGLAFTLIKQKERQTAQANIHNYQAVRHTLDEEETIFLCMYLLQKVP